VNGQASVELLEATHQFPCTYWFKAIGRDEQSFVARVVAAVRQQTHSESDPPYRLRSTAGGAHVAVTLEVPMESPQQVLAVYERVRAVEGLVMLW
jgi:putative lipoic acid-binding regulatory protein